MRIRLFAPIAIALLAFSSIAMAGCSSETKDKTKDALESAKDDAKTATNETAARAAAEELRTRMKANDTANKEGIRSISALEESAKDLTGKPEVTGISDNDGDGLDDDGKVQVDVGDSSACLTLPATGENTTVKGGAC